MSIDFSGLVIGDQTTRLRGAYHIGVLWVLNIASNKFIILTEKRKVISLTSVLTCSCSLSQRRCSEHQ